MTTTVAFDLDGTLVSEWTAPGTAALPGAVSALRWCRRRGYRVVLYSWNTEATCRWRLRAAGVPAGLFDAVLAVPLKTAEVFDRVLGPLLGDGPLAVVGNSWRHDVVPALGRADAIVWTRGARAPGVMGTPADTWRYPVRRPRSVATLPRVLPAALAEGYDKAAWLPYRRAVPEPEACAAVAGGHRWVRLPLFDQPEVSEPVWPWPWDDARQGDGRAGPERRAVWRGGDNDGAYQPRPAGERDVSGERPATGLPARRRVAHPSD